MFIVYIKIMEEQTPEQRVRRIEERVEFYLREVSDFAIRKGFATRSMYGPLAGKDGYGCDGYLHNANSMISKIRQYHLGNYERDNDTKHLLRAEKKLLLLDIYFRLLEEFPEFCEGEMRSSESPEGRKHYKESYDMRKQLLEHGYCPGHTEPEIGRPTSTRRIFMRDNDWLRIFGLV